MTVELTVATTVSALAKKDLHVPFNDATLIKVLGTILAVVDEQQTAATATTKHIVRHSGLIKRLEVGTVAAPGAGESMTFDVQKNGATILTGGPLSIDQATAASPAGVFNATAAVIPGSSVAVGDVISIIRTYTAGTPAMTETTVWLDAGG